MPVWAWIISYRSVYVHRATDILFTYHYITIATHWKIIFNLHFINIVSFFFSRSHAVFIFRLRCVFFYSFWFWSFKTPIVRTNCPIGLPFARGVRHQFRLWIVCFFRWYCLLLGFALVPICHAFQSIQTAVN